MSAADAECRTCLHPRWAHVYHEGACRGGFVCDVDCDEFVAPDQRMRLVDFDRGVIAFPLMGASS